MKPVVIGLTIGVLAGAALYIAVAVSLAWSVTEMLEAIGGGA